MAENKVDQCDRCGIIDHIKSKVTSVIHEHHAAHKCQKTTIAEIVFRDVKTGDPVELCENCQNIMVGGTFHGRNWK